MKVTPEAETDSILADKIVHYLESHDKTINAAVLNETVQRMRHVIVRDLMQPRDSRAGKESNTLYTGACARKARLTFDGAEREPLRARTLLKFLLGDLVELSVLAMANLAGCHIMDNNIDLSVVGSDGVAVPVHPDGRYVDTDGTQYNVEIKSCDSRTFDEWKANGGPTDTWGYKTQASIEVAAWREYGYPVNSTLFLAVSTGSRQGSIAEFIVPYESDLVIGWHCRRNESRRSLPVVPFPSVPELNFVRGKECNAEWFTHGTPEPRRNEKGAIYGWDVPTGREIVPLMCSYCDFMAKHCWTTAQLEMDGTKPQWIVPANKPEPPVSAGEDGPPPSAPVGAGQAPAHRPTVDEVLAPYRHALRGLATDREINAWYKSLPKDVQSDLYDDYSRAMDSLTKGRK